MVLENEMAFLPVQYQSLFVADITCALIGQLVRHYSILFYDWSITLVPSQPVRYKMKFSDVLSSSDGDGHVYYE